MTKKPPLKERLKTLLLDYGKIAIITYFTIFFLVLGAFFIGISAGLKKPDGETSKLGLLAMLGAAYGATKLTQPIRILVTLALTPVLGRGWARIQRRHPTIAFWQDVVALVGAELGEGPRRLRVERDEKEILLRATGGEDPEHIWALRRAPKKRLELIHGGATFRNETGTAKRQEFVGDGTWTVDLEGGVTLAHGDERQVFKG
jgi:hypothetical protein